MNEARDRCCGVGTIGMRGFGLRRRGYLAWYLAGSAAQVDLSQDHQLFVPLGPALPCSEAVLSTGLDGSVETTVRDRQRKRRVPTANFPLWFARGHMHVCGLSRLVPRSFAGANACFRASQTTCPSIATLGGVGRWLVGHVGHCDGRVSRCRCYSTSSVHAYSLERVSSGYRCG